MRQPSTSSGQVLGRGLFVLVMLIIFAACDSGADKTNEGPKGSDAEQRKDEGSEDGDDDKPAPPAPATLEDACSAYAAASCHRFETCDHGFRLKFRYTDAAACLSAQKAHCLDHVQAPDTSVKPADLSACAAAVKTIPCAQVTAELSNYSVTACRFTGTRAAKAACGVHAQCRSGMCKNWDKKACGECLRISRPKALREERAPGRPVSVQIAKCFT